MCVGCMYFPAIYDHHFTIDKAVIAIVPANMNSATLIEEVVSSTIGCSCIMASDTYPQVMGVISTTMPIK